MGKASAPQAPDPTATANAQTQSNQQTAQSQAQLNMIDQVGPGGSQKYTQIGTYADGTPKYQQTTSLDPKSQGIYNAGLGTQQNLANLAQQKSGELGGMLSQPLNFDAQKQYLEGLTSGALDKSWDRNKASLDTQLSNQGIKLGSDAHTRAQNDFGVTRSDAYNSANVNNYNTALQSQMALRSQPLNELLALSGQSQIQQPQFGSTPQTGVAGTDVAGLINQGYSNQLNAVNQQNQQTGQTLGGLFSAGASLIPFFSDERLKENIEKTGKRIGGTDVVTWDWKDGSGSDTGVIAQALEKKHPELVDKSHPSGMRRVDYAGLMRLGARK